MLLQCSYKVHIINLSPFKKLLWSISTDLSEIFSGKGWQKSYWIKTAQEHPPLNQRQSSFSVSGCTSNSTHLALSGDDTPPTTVHCDRSDLIASVRIFDSGLLQLENVITAPKTQGLMYLLWMEQTIGRGYVSTVATGAVAPVDLMKND